MIVIPGLAAAAAMLASPAEPDVARHQFCAAMTFRETPFSDMRCARELAPDALGDRKYFRLSYDAAGRLVEVSFRQNGALRAHEGRFVRAPMIRIAYEPGLEIRRYYDEHGNRTLVSGNVYETRFTLSDENERLTARFFGIEGEVVEDHFGIARYAWSVDPHAVVTEHRYDIAGNITRNRPGFGYFVTRFHFDADGLLRRMENWGEDGVAPVPDDAGIVATEIRYNDHAQFTRWRNLGEDGQARRGMSAIAEIRYDPGPYYSEQRADFIDADGSPQATRWGAHTVAYSFDRFGNPVERRFLDADGARVTVNNGTAQVRSRWTDDGAVLLEDAYFDADGNAVARSDTGIHAYRSRIDDAGRIVETVSVNLVGEPVTDPATGYARRHILFDHAGRQTGERFSDAAGQSVDHAVWGFAEVRYSHDGRELTGVIYRNAAGEAVQPVWNPAH